VICAFTVVSRSTALSPQDGHREAVRRSGGEGFLAMGALGDQPTIAGLEPDVLPRPEFSCEPYRPPPPRALRTRQAKPQGGQHQKVISVLPRMTFSRTAVS
jgi:hypothetical protein